MQLFKPYLSLFLLVLPICSTGQSREIKNPYADFTRNIIYLLPGDTDHIICSRIMLDLDADGLTDLALSDNGTKGNAGNDWYCYFKLPDGNYYHTPQKIFFHPDLIKLTVNKQGKQLITFHKNNCCSGYLNYFNVRRHQLIPAGTKFIPDTNKRAALPLLFKSFREETWSPNCISGHLNNCWPRL